MAEDKKEAGKKEPWDNLRKIKAFSQQPNELLDKQRITNEASLMYPVYEHALDALKNVMASSENWVRESSDSHKKDFYGYGNNVIAFCAPRGQGKTSAMLSLSHALEHCDDVIMNGYSYPFNSDEDRYGRKRASRCFVKEQGTLWKETIESKHFLVMPPIDPTVLDGKESVVNLVLAWLFQEINEAWKKCQDSPDRIEGKKQELLKHFQKCRECLARHNGTKDADFSDLIKKSVIFEIKEHLYEIIKCYFQVCGISKSGIENYLIIQLDDTDMDMVNAYDVLEDVRKFLSLPQTIVLMATYLRQLRMLVAKHYEDVLSFPHGNKGENQHPIDYMQMAAKYIDKLIPAQQMIHIGSFRNQRDLNNRVSIHSFMEANSDEDESTGTEPKKNESDDLEEAFIALIYAKTGLSFEKHSSYVNNILPTTLRGLVHLFQLLDRMELPDPENKLNTSTEIDFDNRYHNLQIQQRNLLIFEDYFRNDWCYSNLVEADQEIMWKISQTHVAPKLRIIRNLLLERWKWTEDWWKSRNRTDFEPVLNKGVVTLAFNTNTKEFEDESLHYVFNNTTGSIGFSITFTDMIYLLEEAEHRAESMNDLLLNFAIRTHLSILLNKLYLADELNSSREKLNGKERDTEKEKGVLRGTNHPQLKSFLKYEVYDDENLSIEAIKTMLGMFASNENGYDFRNAEENDVLIKALLDCLGKESSALFDNKTIEKLLQSLEATPDDFSKKGELKDACIKHLEPSPNQFHSSVISYRMALLYKLFFFDWNSKIDTPEKVSKLNGTVKEYEQQCFSLQTRIFNLLGNHEVLRLWLSDDPKRFAKCQKYIWEDTGSSVKSALDNVYTILYPKEQTSTGERDAHYRTQPDELPDDPKL